MNGIVRAVGLSIATLAVPLVIAGCATLGIAPTQTALQNILLSSQSGIAADTSAETMDALVFYERRNFQPAWTGSAAAEAMAAGVRAVLARANEHGLRREDYAAAEGRIGTRSAPGLPAARYDLALTRAVLRYARDLRTGRVRPNDVYTDVGLPAVHFDAPASLERAIGNDSVATFLADLSPLHPEYHALLEALARYRRIADEGGWPSLPARNEIGLEGNDPRREALIARLAFEDPDLAANPDPSVAELREAVRRFQVRNHLEVDGFVGPNTLAVLNIPAAVRVEQIAANLERWRWLPPTFETTYIAVDVPDQSLEFVRDGNVILSSRVIVGRETSTTPILRTTVAAVKANPPWNVPGDIAARDFLPQLRRDPNYLESRNMVVLDHLETDPHGRNIDWREVTPAQFYYHIQQLPGPQTGLGALMLDMPNDFDIYLHDTPDKHLFELDERTISNGCIRVQEIISLASLALSNDDEEGARRLDEAIASGDTQFLQLDNPLPVYMLYWTVAVSPNGEVEFRPDWYGRDHPLIDALNAPRGPVTDPGPGPESVFRTVEAISGASMHGTAS